MEPRKLLLTAAALAVLFLLPATAKADPFVLTLDASRTVATGGMTTFFGSLSNLGAPGRFTNSVSITLNYAGPGAITIDDSPFFANVPALLGPMQSVGPVAFFDVAVSALVTPGMYAGSFTASLFDDDDNELLVTQEFTLNVAPRQTAPIPEPVTLLLFGSGLLGVAAAKRRRLRALKP